MTDMTDKQDKLRETLISSLREVSRLREDMANLEASFREPIAIVGMGLRLPGGVSDLEGFWSLLEQETDTVGPIPEGRWSGHGFYDPDPEAKGKSYVREAAFCDAVDRFDADFFGISPREAQYLDPRHRLLLETTWHALEDAGIVPASLKDSTTGVYVGTNPSDYGQLRFMSHGGDAYAVTGMQAMFAAGRLAFTLGVQGPTLSVDTACSSSLVALHLACQALRRRECDLAIAAGAQVMASPDTFTVLSRTRALAPDGRSKTFSEAANGYGRGEGAVVVAVQRLGDARARGRRVLAVVRGSAINHDGQSSGITVPNGASQQKVLRAALEDARLAPADVDVVECHGTGTSLGDPIEVHALAAVYGKGRDAGRPLFIGAVKTNIGHLEPVAGLAGLAKVVASMRHGKLPSTLHTRPRNAHIDWEALPLEVVDSMRPWTRGDRPRRAGVSAFGLSGTNAHVILEEAERSDQDAAHDTIGPWPIVLSGKTPEALRAQAERLRAHLESYPALALRDAAYSLATRRTHFDHRAAIAAGDRTALKAALGELARGTLAPNTVVGHARTPGKLALLFTGQGSQRLGMGRSLYEAFPVFRAALDAVFAQLDPRLEQPLREVLFAAEDSTRLDRTEFTQPALFALEVALFRTLEAWGMQPDLLLGHSIGELAAAHVAGVLDLADACALVAARARLMQALPEGGAMLSIQASETEVREVLAGREARLDIGAVNGPMSTVVSGDEPEVLDVQRHFEGLGRKTKRLRVRHAFHSPRMEGILESFRQVAAGVKFHAPRIPIVSNLTGKRVTAEEITSPDYWVRHVRHAVRFGDGVRALESDGVATVLELGPHGTLCAMAQESLSPPAQERIAFFPVLRSDRPDLDTLLASLGGLHARGHVLDWDAYFAASGARQISLPGYAFQGERHWIAAPTAHSSDVASAGLVPAEHPLLGAAISMAAADEIVFTGRLTGDDPAWLADHVVFDTCILPGTAFVELALVAAHKTGLDTVEELTLEAPLVLPPSGSAVHLQLAVGPLQENGRRALTLHARPEAAAAETPWTRHATGTLGPATAMTSFDLRAWPPAGATRIDLDGFYERMAHAGFTFGPHFRSVRAAWLSGADLFVEVHLPAGSEEAAGRYGLHPALLDGTLHALARDIGGSSDVRLPFAWSGVSLHAKGAHAVRARVSPSADGKVSVAIADVHGHPVASIGALLLRPASRAQVRTALAEQRDSLHRVDWVALPAHEPAPPEGRWALLEREGVALSAALETLDARMEWYPDRLDLQAALDGGLPVPDVLVVPFAWSATAQSDLPGTGHTATQRALVLLQTLLRDDRLASSKIVFLTRRAVATSTGEDVLDLLAAPVWGLLRSAQLEHPERNIVVVDLEGRESSLAGLPAALASGENQLSLRHGRYLAPRLVRTHARTAENGRPPFAPEGTVLVTGGTGTLGRLLARHLVETHGVRHLLLTSRRGHAAPEAASLLSDLEVAGAHVTLAACDMADRDAVRQLLASVPHDHPLTAVVHTAGEIDDGMLLSLTPERTSRVLRSKLDAALHLHELTKGLDLSAFVLFSSLGGVIGSAGQSNYAAGNAFLDALAHHRRAQGLPALSLAWGFWAERGGMTAHLSEADRQRIARFGVLPLSRTEGLALFDAALRCEDALVVPARLEAVPAARPRAVASAARPSDDLGQRLAALSEAERERAIFELVRSEVATVLGHTSPDAIEATRPLQELGVDSLLSVELRNRLATATGLRLPTTLLFDHPTLSAIVRRLRDDLLGRLDIRLPAAPSPSRTATDDPIAIVAMSCRYPGGIDSPERLWQLLIDGGDAISPFPTDRGWKLSELYDPDPDQKGKTYAREGGFLYDAALFDPGFFGISPRETLAIDPQQRLLLETSWEALERAGISPGSLQGSSTGVFTGIMYSDYGARLVDASGDFEGYLGNGSAPSIASGRIAYTFGFEGPAVTIDTACSSSLVAIHLACQSLREGDCTLALAGGATLMATPSIFVEFSRLRGLSPDGRCKAFSADADGTGWSEGVGMVLLERLSDARRHGHPVLAIVRGSAVNQDGRSQGLTAPNGPSQQRVIHRALDNAGLSPADVDAVEAHGTGTVLGDPIEAQALLATYGREHSADRPLWLGAIKSNLGHTQAAAGVAGVMKMVMAMQHGVLPKTLHADAPSTHVDWSEGAVRLLNAATPWPVNRPRRAGISSFGISGTNAHLIVEQAPAADAPAPQAATAYDGALPLLLSAKGEAALRAQAERLHAHLHAHPELAPVDVAHALATTRMHFEHRTAIPVTDRTEVLDALEALMRGERVPQARTGTARAPGKLAFLFTGQGSQHLGMGQKLHATFPVFRQVFDAICAHLDPRLPRPLRDVVFAARESEASTWLDETVFAQTSLFALEVASFRLLESWGLTPDVLLGHSIGELSAAHVAGVLSLEDACALVGARARLMQALPRGGAMVSVQASEQELEPRLEATRGAVSLAGQNGPQSSVVSGEEEAVLALAQHFEALGRKTKRLKVSHAFHSACMDAMLAEFEQVASTLAYHPPRIPIVSNVTGRRATFEELGSPSYWVRHVRGSVRFLDGVRTLEGEGITHFVELGPHGVLCAMAEACLSDEARARAVFVPMLKHDLPDTRAVAAALGDLHVRGHALDWSAFFAPLGAKSVPLPTYAFQRARYWLEPSRKGGHPFLGAEVPLADAEGVLFTGRLSRETDPWLADHAVWDDVLLPATAFLELAVAAGHRTGAGRVDELALEAPLALPAKGGVEFQLSVGAADESGHRAVSLHARPEGASDVRWTRHASGRLAPAGELPMFDLQAWPPAQAVPLDVTDLYPRLAEAGLVYGPHFQGLVAAWKHEGDLFAEVQLPESGDAGAFALHPALLDAALHALTLDAGGNQVELPFAWSGVTLDASHAPSTLRVRLSRSSRDEGGAVSLAVADGSGVPVGRIDALRTRPASAAKLEAPHRAVQDSLYEVNWTAVSGSATGPLAPDVTVVSFDAEPSQAARPAHEAAQRALSALRGWLTDDRHAAGKIVLLTRSAIAIDATETLADVAAATVWGLGRAAQSEHADRTIVLVDHDGHPASLQALAGAVASGEPQIALRGGTLHVPRLVRARPALEAVQFDPERTVLITGGTGTLGGLVARHVVEKHGARHLVLASRQGLRAPGADARKRALEAAGAQVSVVACDAADRGALARLLAAIPAEHPLGAVVHTAGVLDDGVLLGLTPERLAHVLASKIDGAVHLHELTQGLDLSAFVLFSSLAGVVGSPGQGNYAAANTFLDALAQHRRARGMAASSIAWGYWAEASGMTARVSEPDRRRTERLGIGALDTAHALALLDAAMGHPSALLVAARFDMTVLHAHAARQDRLPALFRTLVRVDGSRSTRRAPTATLRQRFATLSEARRSDVVLEVVSAEVAAVLGHTSGGDVEPDRPLQELGLDSLMALELRTRLGTASGLRLPATLLFNHPTPSALARALEKELAEGVPSPAASALSAVEKLDDLLATVAANDAARAGITDRLRALLSKWNGPKEAEPVSPIGDLAVATNDELFELIEKEFDDMELGR